jgi:hypothetical protein
MHRALPPAVPSCWGPLPPAPPPASAAAQARADVVVGCSDPQDCTADIQAALDDASGRTLVFTARTYITTPLVLRANHSVLHFRAGSMLLAKAGAFRGGADTLLTVQGANWEQDCNSTCSSDGCPLDTCYCPEASNITIVGYGATFKMHRADYARPPYILGPMSRMTLAVQGVRNLTIAGLTFEDAGGDGIYLGQVQNQDVVIRDVTVLRSFRNGLTVGNIKGLRVENVVLAQSNGTAPAAGVDFESDMCYASLEGIVFQNVSAVQNTGTGFQFTLGPSPLCSPWGGQIPVTASLRNISVIGSGKFGVSASADGPFPPGGWLRIDGLHVRDTVSAGLLVEDKGMGWPFSITNAHFENVSAHACPFAECPDGPLWIEGRNHQCAVSQAPTS